MQLLAVAAAHATQRSLALWVLLLALLPLITHSSAVTLLQLLVTSTIAAAIDLTTGGNNMTLGRNMSKTIHVDNLAGGTTSVASRLDKFLLSDIIAAADKTAARACVAAAINS